MLENQIEGIGLYVEDEQGNPQPCSDPVVWALALGRKRWRLGDLLSSGGLTVRVSTCFTGLDARVFKAESEPILYETTAFGDVLDQAQQRYYTREEARKGHEAMCERAFEAMRAHYALDTDG